MDILIKDARDIYRLSHKYLLRLEKKRGIKTLQELVDAYSEQEILEDWFNDNRKSKTFQGIIDGLRFNGFNLYPTEYDRLKAIGGLPDPQGEAAKDIVIMEYDFPGEMKAELANFRDFKTFGDVVEALRLHGHKHKAYELSDFSFLYGWNHYKLIRTLALHGLMPKDATFQPRWRHG